MTANGSVECRPGLNEAAYWDTVIDQTIYYRRELVVENTRTGERPWSVAVWAAHMMATESKEISRADGVFMVITNCGEKGVRMAQKMQVGPCIVVEIQP